jgi:hypothetical protein
MHLRRNITRHAAARFFRYAWAAPDTVLGFVFGFVGWLFGASARFNNGTVQFCGGRLFGRAGLLPSRYSFCAITFGHVILAENQATLAAVRLHEEVHVRQYERWGPFFVPAYLLSSLVQVICGGNPYRDNCFERQAYESDATREQLSHSTRE